MKGAGIPKNWYWIRFGNWVILPGNYFSKSDQFRRYNFFSDMFNFTKTKKRTIQLLYTTTLSFILTTNAFAQTWAPVGASANGISPTWGSFQNLVADQSGNLYCSFYDGSVTKGSVMKYDGSSWSYLGGAGITPGTATYNSLALAANGDVFYSHQLGWPASGLSVQKYNGTSWRFYTSVKAVNRVVCADGSSIFVGAYIEFGFYE